METETVPGAAEAQTQRVRVGMIGLAFVFLLVMLATVLLSVGRDAGDLMDNQSSQSANNSTDEAPREPLAELGVAPGNPVETAKAPVRPPAR